MGLSIGLCYDLKDDYLRDGFSPEDVLEFDSEETVAGLEARWPGSATPPSGSGAVASSPAASSRASGGTWCSTSARASGGARARPRSPALCELFDQPYTFADPLTCAVTLDKAVAKRIVRDHGLATAPFSVVSSPEEAASVRLPAPLFLKPVAEGSSKGVTGRSLVRERRDLASACRALLEQFRQPVLVEAFLPGREVTVGIVGHGAGARVVGVMEVSFTDRAETLAYTALNKEEYQDRVSYRLIGNEPLAEQARDVALAVFHALGCRDAARVDLRCDAAGRLNFLEVNPLPGINHVRSDLPIMARLGGISYQELIGAIVDSARSRWAQRR